MSDGNLEARDYRLSFRPKGIVSPGAYVCGLMKETPDWPGLRNLPMAKCVSIGIVYDPLAPNRAVLIGDYFGRDSNFLSPELSNRVAYGDNTFTIDDVGRFAGTQTTSFYADRLTRFVFGNREAGRLGRFLARNDVRHLHFFFQPNGLAVKQARMAVLTRPSDKQKYLSFLG